jgi:hypothetical protein
MHGNSEDRGEVTEQREAAEQEEENRDQVQYIEDKAARQVTFSQAQTGDLEEGQGRRHHLLRRRQAVRARQPLGRQRPPPLHRSAPRRAVPGERRNRPGGRGGDAAAGDEGDHGARRSGKRSRPNKSSITNESISQHWQPCNINDTILQYQPCNCNWEVPQIASN